MSGKMSQNHDAQNVGKRRWIHNVGASVNVGASLYSSLIMNDFKINCLIILGT